MKAYKIIKVPERVSMCTTGKYQLKYPVGSIVTAPEETLGIICFSTNEYVQEFTKGMSMNDLSIIEVEGIGKALFPKEITWLNNEKELDFFYKARRPRGIISLTKPPSKGTICFQKVKVLN